MTIHTYIYIHTHCMYMLMYMYVKEPYSSVSVTDMLERGWICIYIDIDIYIYIFQSPIRVCLLQVCCSADGYMYIYIHMHIYICIYIYTYVYLYIHILEPYSGVSVKGMLHGGWMYVYIDIYQSPSRMRLSQLFCSVGDCYAPPFTHCNTLHHAATHSDVPVAGMLERGECGDPRFTAEGLNARLAAGR